MVQTVSRSWWRRSSKRIKSCRVASSKGLEGGRKDAVTSCSIKPAHILFVCCLFVVLKVLFHSCSLQRMEQSHLDGYVRNESRCSNCPWWWDHPKMEIWSFTGAWLESSSGWIYGEGFTELMELAIDVSLQPNTSKMYFLLFLLCFRFSLIIVIFVLYLCLSLFRQCFLICMTKWSPFNKSSCMILLVLLLLAFLQPLSFLLLLVLILIIPSHSLSTCGLGLITSPISVLQLIGWTSSGTCITLFSTFTCAQRGTQARIWLNGWKKFGKTMILVYDCRIFSVFFFVALFIVSSCYCFLNSVWILLLSRMTMAQTSQKVFVSVERIPFCVLIMN